MRKNSNQANGFTLLLGLCIYNKLKGDSVFKNDFNKIKYEAPPERVECIPCRGDCQPP
jgi:hypothetical protein